MFIVKQTQAQTQTQIAIIIIDNSKYGNIYNNYIISATL